MESVIAGLVKALHKFQEPSYEAPAVAAVVADNLFAVHNQGQALNGSSIGQYSTSPIYVSPSRSPKKFTPRGQTGRSSKFKNGKTRKSRYFPQGYKEYRSLIGREVNVVNLSLSGKLSKEYNLQLRGGEYVAGFTTSSAANKASGAERRFKKPIYGLGSRGKDVFGEVLTEQNQNIFNAI